MHILQVEVQSYTDYCLYVYKYLATVYENMCIVPEQMKNSSQFEDENR